MPAEHPRRASARRRLAPALLGVLTLVGAASRAQSASPADNCEPLRAQIEARLRANGLQDVRLLVADATAVQDGEVRGKVVGTCGLGRRRIVQPAPGATPAAKPGEALLTECRDGSVRVGGDCPR